MAAWWLGLMTACTTEVRLAPQPVCGNREVEGAEACDDGNDDDTDACTTSCEAAVCGDGLVQRGVEGCDDGNDDDTDACLATCVSARCGDGLVQRGVEDCDDGADNASPDATCSADCTVAELGPVDVRVEPLDGGAGRLREPVKLTVADLDRDANLELLVQIDTFDMSDPISLGGVVMVMGDGTGDLWPPQRLLDDRARPLAAPALADLDGDGHMDMLGAADGATDSLILFRGSPYGLLPGELVPTGAAGAPRAAMVQDLDGDRDLDIITVNQSDRDDVTLLLGDGSGGFVVAGQLDASSGTVRAALLADVTDDGMDDVVILADQGLSLVVLPRTGALTFARPVELVLTEAEHDLAPLDHDWSGGPELIVLYDGESSARVVDWTGRGLEEVDGIELRAGASVCPHVGVPPAVGDVDGDRHDDLFFACDQAVLALTHSRDPGVYDLVEMDCPGCGSAYADWTSGVALGDLDGDGATDLAESWNSGELAVWWGGPDGPAGSPARLATEPHAGPWPRLNELVAGDVDANGLDDLVSMDNRGPFVLPAAPGRRVVSTGALRWIMADATAVRAIPGERPTVITVGQTHTTFAEPLASGRTGLRLEQRTDGLHPAAVAAGPIDGDAAEDFVVVTDEGATYLLEFGVGDGTFPRSDALPTSSPGTDRVWLADADGDGVTDLFGMDRFAGVIEARRGVGDGTFEPARLLSAGAGGAPADLAVVDLDDDGAAELVWVEAGTGTLTVAAGRRGFDWRAPVVYDVPGAGDVVAVAVGDATGDGWLDVAALAGDGVHLRLGFGNGALSVPHHVTAGDDPRDVVMVDLDRDGTDEIVVANRGSDDLTVLSPGGR